MQHRPTWLLGVGFAFTVACGGGGMQTPMGMGPNVVISDFAFSPNSLTIKAGQTVTWTNSGPSMHDVMSDSSDMMMFQSGNLAAPAGGTYGTAGGTFAFMFNTPGTYSYHDALYPPSMAQYANFTGTIVVTQ
jgi:plastocyanin